MSLHTTLMSIKKDIDRDIFVAKVAMTFAVRLWKLSADEANEINQKVIGPMIQQKVTVYNNMVLALRDITKGGEL